MLTLYELKQNPVFRCCYKSPYYIKNMFLMIVLSVLLFIIYAIYFRADGGNYANIIKILKGLNSNTFNYLETNKNLLGLGKAMPEFKIDYESASARNVNTLEFFSDCVRLNRPCALRNLAQSWPATTKWSITDEKSEGWTYLEKLFGTD